VGAIIAPLTVPWIATTYNWQTAFILTGAIGFIWLLFWLPMYRRPQEHPKVSRAELDHIQSDPPDPPAVRVRWMRLVPHRQTSAFAIGKYLTDPVWWFYLYWIPGFFREHYKIDLLAVGPPLIIIYVIADIGSIGGGWLSSTVHQARLDHQSRAQNRHADLCARGDADHFCVAGQKHLVGRGNHRVRRCCASGLVLQPVHHNFRHVSA
jgi:MFS family permease